MAGTPSQSADGTGQCPAVGQRLLSAALSGGLRSAGGAVNSRQDQGVAPDERTVWPLTAPAEFYRPARHVYFQT